MSIGIVNTRFGEIRGEELTGKYAGITTFRSVPYAQPPVGNLRFRDPVELIGWEGVLDATHFASRPMQESESGITIEPWASDFYASGNPPMSEDCLYLHITTGAQSSGERRPVFMWFHGGGLSSGYYSEIEFDPSELARKGIVVVSVGQRLNVFGYLCLPQLAAESNGSTGNFGLKDEVMALNWVYENIAAFGGDPDNITVGGQSGGTAKSTALATSPKAGGKIKRVINQSNLAWMRNYQSMDAAFEAGKAYLKNLGLDPDTTPEELRKIPAYQFYQLQRKIKGWDELGGIPGSMVCDGAYIASISAKENMQNYASEVDYLSGGNVGESSLRGIGLMPGERFKTEQEFYDYMKEKLGTLYEKYEFEKNWPVTSENVDYMARVLASRAFSDSWGLMGGVIINRYFGAYRAKHAPKARNFSYLFDHYPPSRTEEKGTFRDQNNLLAWHSAELWYTFASMRQAVPACRPWKDGDFHLAEMVSSYWANFIRTGDPNGCDSEGNPLPYWPESRENFGWMQLKEEPQGHEGLDEIDKIALEMIAREKKYPEI